MDIDEIKKCLIDRRRGITKVNKNVIKNFLNGDYFHIACIMVKIKKNKYIPISYGINTCNGNTSRHAEYEAVKHLRPLEKGKNLKDISILVIRISKLQELCNSKPCFHCVKCLNKDPLNKGYKIKNVFYSDENRVIKKENINILLCTTTYITRGNRTKTY
jgi:hypothetical protein